MQAISQKKRVLTALVGLPVLAVALYCGGWPLLVIVAAASVVGMREFFAMAGRPGLLLEVVGCLLGGLAVVCLAQGLWPALVGLLAGALWLEHFDFLRRFAGRGEKDPPRGLLVSAMLYVPVPLGLLCWFSPLETAFVLAVVMAADTGAYYGGHAVGGAKVWPAVSPGKTWAGTVSGVAAAALAAACFAVATPAGGVPLALAGAVLAVVSQFGDFYESALKRAVGVKDSGAILPGHGGLLDRVDGLLPAILVYAAGRSLLGLG
ncbi:phosphatidate cytidylyltransferase [Solidesulfovibrio sp.]